MATIDFGGTKETVITRKEFPMTKARKVLKDETIAIIGYGVQGPAQALNLRDNGFKVIVGQAKKFKKDWDRARKDGWVPGETLFDIEEAVQIGDRVVVLGTRPASVRKELALPAGRSRAPAAPGVAEAEQAIMEELGLT